MALRGDVDQRESEVGVDVCCDRICVRVIHLLANCGADYARRVDQFPLLDRYLGVVGLMTIGPMVYGSCGDPVLYYRDDVGGFIRG